MVIRPYQSSDQEALSVIYLQGRQQFQTDQLDTSCKYSDFERDICGEEVWVLTDKNDVLGFLSLWQPKGFIHHLYIANRHQSVGLGSRLIEFAKKRYGALSLKCRSDNYRAISFYIKHGFVIHEESRLSAHEYVRMIFTDQ